jgi:hypothetical protein
MLLSAAILIGAAAPIHAATFPFSGTAAATAVPFMDASCAPLPFRGIIPLSDSSGMSNFGSFTYSHNVCTQGATGPVIGTFALDFGGSLLTGLLNGSSAARVGVPGLFDQMFEYTVTGGTGQFVGATGAFTNVGTVDVRGGPPSRLALNFTGTIDVPAVPESASWALMLGGFALVGSALRRRTMGLAFA